jgi:pimeloyl-ACP methyl ester carboxylesterase
MADLKADEFSVQLQAHGVPADLAPEVAGRMDATMKDCILRLYRSAIDVGKEWEPGLANITSRGLVFWGIHDIPCPVEFADHLAKDTKACRVMKLDSNHWTPIQRADEIATALEQHWKASIPK